MSESLFVSVLQSKFRSVKHAERSGPVVRDQFNEARLRVELESFKPVKGFVSIGSGGCPKLGIDHFKVGTFHPLSWTMICSGAFRLISIT